MLKLHLDAGEVIASVKELRKEIIGDIWDWTQQEVPVLTGQLKRSGYFTDTKIGYTAEYAEIVHNWSKRMTSRYYLYGHGSLLEEYIGGR